MADEIPDPSLGSDEDADLAALDALGFDVLAEDPPFGGQADVERRARRHQRRRHVAQVTAVAALVLVVVIGGVVLLRTNGDDAQQVAVGAAPAQTSATYVLPPEDSTDVGFELAIDSVMTGDQVIDAGTPVRYSFVYTAPDGTALRLDVVRDRQWFGAAAGAPTTVAGGGTDDIRSVLGLPVCGPLGRCPYGTWPGTVVETDVVGQVLVTCTGGDAILDGTEQALSSGVPGNPVGAVGILEGRWTFVVRPPDGAIPRACDYTNAAVAAASAAADGLRAVDDAEWRQYLRDHADTNTLDPDRASTTTTMG